MNSVDAAGLGIGDDHPPRIMGVLNVSEESPYDPSVYDDPGEAARYVDEELIGEGADIVDVGLESANKRFDVLSAEEELERLHVAEETIASVSGDAIFSIETRYHEVAEAALDAGFDMVNDIAGFADPEMPAVCEKYDVAVAKMASPPDIERPGAVEETDWATRKSPQWAADAKYVDQVYEALKQNGLTEKTIVDPAFGGWSEAQTIGQDRETFRRLAEFRALDRPMLISINRKNFLGELVDRETEARLPASLAATAMAVERGAHVIRTHDVAETRDAAQIGAAFTERARFRDGEMIVSRLDTDGRRTLRRHLEARGFDSERGSEQLGAVVEVRGLGERAERLRTAVGSTAAEFVAVPGPTDRVLLVGSVAELALLPERISEDSDDNFAIGSAIQNVLQ
ncbi:dihydropteroate synthase [Halobacteria archaeon AArc-dxtr1]|nr:dihydropteroate synthase [Halobacteria archaeon AArc-dxtr1]